MAPVFFKFESDFVQSLRCIPMAARFRLDLCGVKLSLRAWSRFDHATRENLASATIESEGEVEEYRASVCRDIEAIGEHPSFLAKDASPAWRDRDQVPLVVLKTALDKGMPLDGLVFWGALTDLQRFALIKLTKPGHENKNFAPAMNEFGLSGRQRD